MALGDYRVISFKGGKKSGETDCRSRKEAAERACFRPEGEDGALAYQIVKAPNGSYEAKIVAEYGDVPSDLSPYFRG